MAGLDGLGLSDVDIQDLDIDEIFAHSTVLEILLCIISKGSYSTEFFAYKLTDEAPFPEDAERNMLPSWLG